MSKENLHFDINVNKLFSFFSLFAVFSKRNRKYVDRVAIDLYNTRESLGELLSLYFNRNMVHVLYF